MSEELQPCPHCKSTYAHIMGGNYVQVVCQCGASGPWSRTDQGSIDAWNTRADLLPVVKPLVWRLVEERTSFARCRYVADTFIIEHRLHGEHFDLFLRPSATAATRFDTLEAAKDAAQADYEARIRDCLDMTDPADEINRLRAQLAAAEAEKDCAEDVLKAWFDTQKLMSAQLDPKIVDAASGYLRTSRVGGMSNEESDMVLGVIQDMARLNVFSSIYTQAHKTAEADKLAFGERVRDAATDACANVIKNYDVLKPDGKTYEPIRVQKAAKGMVSLAREDIRALDPRALMKQMKEKENE